MTAELVGWTGSVLLIVSLKQKDPARFRILNLIASALLGAFALAVGAWPSFTVNALSVVVNTHELWTLSPRRIGSSAAEEPLATWLAHPPQPEPVQDRSPVREIASQASEAVRTSPAHTAALTFPS